MIELKNVKKKYKNRVLFKDVNLKINGVGLYSFVGDNGCGKTTILNLISIFIKPSSGKVVNKIKGVSFISQKVNLLDNLTVKEHFKMFNIDYNLLKKVNLYSKLDKYPNELSFGMKQRIAILLGLYSNSSLVVCDEPTSHLDYYNSLLIMREIKNISRNKMVLLVSHNEKFVKKYSDEIYKIEDQKVLKIKEKERVNEVKFNKRKDKNRFNIYLKACLKRNKKTNFGLFVISFFLLFVLCLTVNLKQSFSTLINSDYSLDYNKFYLKECKDVNDEKVVVKKCFNLRNETIEKLKNSEHIISLNYDVLLNDLYNTNKINVVQPNNVILKSGKYPQTYNEVVANDSYMIGEKITLEASKVINSNKIDIYKSKVVFTVVGIAESVPFIKENKLYLDYDVIEKYLKDQKLINNKITLYEYFNKIDINDYKYVLYFKDIDLNILKYNNIEYLSSSYDYYQSLIEALNEIIVIMNGFNLFITLTSFFYFFRLVRKQVKSRTNDIEFFKASGVNVRKITKIFNKESALLLFQAYLSSALIVFLGFRIIFKGINVNLRVSLALVIFLIWFNKLIYKKEIKRGLAL